MKLHLFEGYGLELEYMLVDARTLDVAPVADQVLKAQHGSIANDTEYQSIGWSNEFALHVIELKTGDPVSRLDGLAGRFHESVKRINTLLGGEAVLLGTGMHPWMDPFSEMRLWPHGNSEIYAAYDAIFNCRGHGFANLQSMHLNLPYYDDDEFCLLHTAIRTLLPLLPGLAASSPVAEGRLTKWKDFRIKTYRHNQDRVPEVAGEVIPEPVQTIDEYNERIWQPTYRAIAPLDPQGILQDEWLNSRGAILRTQRNAIEIRLIDVQECPQADVALAALVCFALQDLVPRVQDNLQAHLGMDTQKLYGLLMHTAQEGEAAHIGDTGYLRLLGLEGSTRSAGKVWQQLAERAARNYATREYDAWWEHYLAHGTLATRIEKSLPNVPQHNDLFRVYKTMAHCLQHNKLYEPQMVTAAHL